MLAAVLLTIGAGRWSPAQRSALAPLAMLGAAEAIAPSRSPPAAQVELPGSRGFLKHLCQAHRR